MRLLLCLGFFMLTSIFWAQQFDKEKLEAIFDHLQENDKAMGSIALMHNGKTVYSRSIGYTDLDKKVKATPKSLYSIGSISKIYTAVMALQLVEKGKLSLETKLSEYFPKVVNAEQISIEQLLRHRSGIFNLTSDETLHDWAYAEISREQLLDKIYSYPSVFAPGKQFDYSNSGYLLLSYIIEDVTGMSYNDALQKMIVKKCGIKDTKISALGDKDYKTLSYKKFGEWTPERITNLNLALGGGGIASTAEEVNKFLHCLNTGKLLSASSLEKMKSLVDGYGLGVFQVPFHEHSGFGHNGGIDGYQSMAYYFDAEQVGFTYLSNAVDFPINDVAILVLSEIFGKDYTLPTFSELQKLPEGQLKQYLGNYSADNFPMSILVQEKNGVMTIFPTGQVEMPIDYVGDHTFTLDAVGLKLVFDPEKEIMHLHQSGMHFILQRKIGNSLQSQEK
ncbi:MAG: serine hydrolase domain-containing protein [Weeksellaceae bacterium]|nr:serine hydrolase domain-containing protein [Weeksellaceae bacterium]